MSEQTFRVGIGRQIMHPAEPVPLAGYGNEPERFHKRITEDICATCIAITDSDGTTVLMIGVDFCSLNDELGDRFRKLISQKTNVPPERIYISSTHSHAAPALYCDVPSIRNYLKVVDEKIVAATVEALADRKAADGMYTGSIETRGMNFVKHYKARSYTTGEISYIGDQFGTEEGKDLLEHATQVDPTMHLVKFTRQGGPDVVIVNWRAHPHFAGDYKRYDLSSDYIGVFRDALDTLCGCRSVYFQGACGNVNHRSRFPKERPFTNQRTFGCALAAFAAEGLAQHMTKVEPGRIKTRQMSIFGEINHTMNHLIEPASEICRVWDTTFDLEHTGKMGEPFGIRSPYHARAIIKNAQRTTGKDGKIILNAVSLGDALAFVTFPGEMFDSVSVRMEENSPYNTTLMLGYCDHSVGYLPSAVAYKYTSYETDTTWFVAGTGEKVADAYVAMLKEVKGERG